MSNDITTLTISQLIDVAADSKKYIEINQLNLTNVTAELERRATLVSPVTVEAPIVEAPIVEAVEAPIEAIV